MGIYLKAVVECDYADCPNKIEVRCEIVVEAVPGRVRYSIEEPGFAEKGWQERYDHYDHYYSYYCVDHKRKR